MARAIAARLIELDADRDVDAIVLTGAGPRAFRAGVLGQQEAHANGEPQAVIGAFLANRGGARD